MTLSNGSRRTLFRNKLRKSGFSRTTLIWPSILVLLGLIVYPLGTILLQGFFPNLMESGFAQLATRGFLATFKDDYTYRSILNALIFGGVTSVLTGFFGTGLALLVHRRKVYGGRVLGLLIWLIFFTPSYLVAEGWVLMMQQHGILSELFQLPDHALDWFFTPAGLIAAMSFRLFPLVYLSVLNGLKGLSRDYEEAARTLGAQSAFIWAKINIPLLFPSILAGMTLCFAESVSDFGFASALVPQAHIPLLTYSIFTALNQMPVNYAQVSALSLVLIGVIALAMWSQKFILGRGSYSIIHNQIRPFDGESRSAGWTIASFMFIALVFFLPLAGEGVTSLLKNTAYGFAASNFSLVHYANALKKGGESLQALQRSFELSAGTAVVASLLGVILGFVIHRGSGLSVKLLYVLTMSTLAIPGIVLAAGFIFAWNAPYLVPWHLNLYGTLFCVYLAYLAGSLPNAIRLQIASITQIGPSLLKAGQVHGAGGIKIFTRILLPLVSGTFISTLFLIYSHLMFELPASQLLYPPSEPLLPVVIVKFYTELQVEDGSAMTVLGILFVLISFGLGHLIIGGMKRLLVWRAQEAVKPLESNISGDYPAPVPTGIPNASPRRRKVREG